MPYDPYDDEVAAGVPELLRRPVEESPFERYRKAKGLAANPNAVQRTSDGYDQFPIPAGAAAFDPRDIESVKQAAIASGAYRRRSDAGTPGMSYASMRMPDGSLKEVYNQGSAYKPMGEDVFLTAVKAKSAERLAAEERQRVAEERKASPEYRMQELQIRAAESKLAQEAEDRKRRAGVIDSITNAAPNTVPYAPGMQPGASPYGDIPASAKLAAAGGDLSGVGRILADREARQEAIAQRPEDRRLVGEDTRGIVARNLVEKLQAKGSLTPREMDSYRQATAELSKQGFGEAIGVQPTERAARADAAAKAKAIISRADELAGGLFGYASDADINEIVTEAQGLADELAQAGYTPEQINAVMSDIESKLERVNKNEFRLERR